MLEQRQRLQDVLHSDLTDLRANIGRMRGAADHFVQDQIQNLAAIQRVIQTVEVGIGTILVGLDSRSSFGASTSQHRPTPQSTQRPAPQPSPRPSSSRSPFSATVRPGTGFPEPSSRVGVLARTRSSRG